MKNLLILSLTIMCSARGDAAASQYHVAQKDPAAADTNPGTADMPFKTIGAAVAGARLKPGDTLYVHKGVYREAIELSCGNSHHGQPGARIRILAWPGEAVEIKGSDVIADWKKAVPPLPNEKVYVRENWLHNTQQVFCDGKPLVQIAGVVGEGYIQEVNPGKGVQAHCRITRQDGMVVELKWEAGKNIGPSLGAWDGRLSGDAKGVKTEVGWQSKDGQARIFLTTWNNDNEWYPLKDVEWFLDDELVAVLIFGVTAR